MGIGKTNIKDMTQGDSMRLMLAFSMPLMLGNVFQQLYTFVDALIIGRKVGAYALAALGVAEWPVFIMFGVIQGITQGCSVIIAQRFGEKKIDLVQRSVYNSFFICGIGAIIFTIIAEISIYPCLRLLNTPSEIIELTHTYIQILYAGIPVTFVYNMLAAILRALGNSKKPLSAMMVASFGNIILDLIFVVGMDMGIAGAAYGTVLAQVTAMGYCAVSIRRIELCRIGKLNRAPDKEIIVEEVKIGIPIALQNIITAMGGLVVQAKANGFGILFITGYSAANKLYALLEIAATSYAQGIMTYTAQNKGVDSKARIKDGLKAALIIGTCTALLMSCIMVLCGQNILALFIKDAEVNIVEAIRIGYVFLRILAIGFPLLYALYVIRACIQGLGNTVFPMLSSFVQVFMRVTCAFLLTEVVGNTGIFWGEIFAWLGADIFLVSFLIYRFYKGST